ncbi:MAG: hypothetical protein J3K34DRAFT_413619 [Monoraphidium minutum]|nr:MAG: hypothetical protein J3K34DRAFT_413619 [Monoraphidium minutum]
MQVCRVPAPHQRRRAGRRSGVRGAPRAGRAGEADRLRCGEGRERGRSQAAVGGGGRGRGRAHRAAHMEGKATRAPRPEARPPPRVNMRGSVGGGVRPVAGHGLSIGHPGLWWIDSGDWGSHLFAGWTGCHEARGACAPVFTSQFKAGPPGGCAAAGNGGGCRAPVVGRGHLSWCRVPFPRASAYA